VGNSDGSGWQMKMLSYRDSHTVRLSILSNPSANLLDRSVFTALAALQQPPRAGDCF